MSVSVIVPAYNAASFITRALESVLSQGPLLHEVLVVDDASTDDTVEVVKRIASNDDRVRLIQLSTNQGPGGARNFGIVAANAEWIAILDADDSFLPNRLAYLLEHAYRYELDFAADNIALYDAAADRVVRNGVDAHYIGHFFELDRYSYVKHCMTNTNDRVDFGLLKPMFRRDFVLRNGLAYPSIRHGEDFVFCLSALVAGGRFGLFPHAFYLYTERTGSISGERSSLSRTAVDYAGLVQSTLNLIKAPHIRQDTELTKLIFQRAQRIAAVPAKVRVWNMWRERRYKELWSLIVRDTASMKAVGSMAVSKIASSFGIKRLCE
jgi:succinoglycan biosynthesis protein ExoO